MKKKLLAGLGVILALGLAACGGSTGAQGSGSDVTLTFMSNVVGDQATELGKVLKDFTAQTGIKVDYSAPGADYESLMTTKMASKDMPDVFTTHGWSVQRYADFLAPVNDQPFFKRITPQMRPVITAKNGDVYVLPVDADIAGIVYNANVLKAAGVDPASLTTWTKFTEALAKIKASGVTPLHVGGKDTWTIGQLGDWIAPSYFITRQSSNQRDALTHGKFDSATWDKVGGLISEWTKAGYFNQDALTADYNSDAAAIANGKAAFGFYGNSFIVDAHTVNPQAKLAMMPIPAATDADQPSLIAGERLAVGVWKDSANKAAAFKLLNFLAQAKNVTKLAEASGSPAGLTGPKPNLGDIQASLTKYASVRTFPYFDRAYLPNGMWDVMCATTADILAGKSDAVTQAGNIMKQNFDDKYQG